GTRLRQHCGERRKSALRTAGSGSSSWPTPMANDGRRPGPDLHSTQGGNLNREAAQWATPTSRDHKDGSNPSEAVATNSLLGRQAPRAAIGIASSPSDPTSPRRLSPLFVAWLMGWPLDCLDLTSSESSATGSSQHRPKQR
ncbi:MAG TPA: hypothetical protein VFH61_08280, partial [Thermoleophilia bacterium]|nr:hypothetical protein [Thermoleophilia bacterium]